MSDIAITGIPSDFALKDVHISENELGCGSSAQVLELEYQGLTCAGKKFHKLLYSSDYCVQGFLKECRLLSQTRHPNIVRFLGIVLEEGIPLPILVMEFLPTDLRRCLDDYGVLPDEISYSILHNVSLGLAYLHSRTPVIVHLDIASINIILSANMTAKICDFGSAMLLESKYKMARIPGHQIYMPPETMVDDPHYDASVDVFSFGVLMTEIFTAKYPMPEIGPARKDSDNPGIIISVSEVERRQNLLNEIGDEHPLMDLITSCLSNNPDQRPKVLDFVNKLKSIALEYHSGNKLDLIKEINALRAQKMELETDIARNAITGGDEDSPLTDILGIEVVSETTLTVTQSSLSFKWKGHGLEIQIPANSLPPEIDRCVLQIYASLSGQYKTPDKNELVSAVFWFRPVPYCNFVQPLTIQIQHCATKDTVKKLSFLRAVCTQESLPYVFKKVEKNESFSENSSYGSIQVTHFSGMVVSAQLQPRDKVVDLRLYSASLYYIRRDIRSWEIHLVVTWDEDVNNTIVERHYKRRGALEGPYMTLEFQVDSESIELKVPKEGVKIRGWEIRPLFRPQLAQARIDYFKPGRKIPSCQLTAKFIGSEADAANINELHFPLVIEGAKEPYNMIAIDIDLNRPISAQQQSIAEKESSLTVETIMEKTGITAQRLDMVLGELDQQSIAECFDDVAMYLDQFELSPADKENVRRQHTAQAAMTAALKFWSQKNPYEATLRKLLAIIIEQKRGDTAIKCVARILESTERR